MGFFGRLWKGVKKTVGHITKGVAKTIGQKSEIIENLASQIPVVGPFIAPYVGQMAKQIGQGQSVMDVVKATMPQMIQSGTEKMQSELTGQSIKGLEQALESLQTKYTK